MINERENKLDKNGESACMLCKKKIETQQHVLFCKAKVVNDKNGITWYTNWKFSIFKDSPRNH